MEKCIIIANGFKPRKSVVETLNERGYETLICADGGAESARNLGLTPHYIIGDLDSVTDNTLNYYKGKSEVMLYTRQDDTDIEKSLKFAMSKGSEEAVLLGAVGDRLDHSFCNLGIALKFYDDIKVRIISHRSLLDVYSGEVELKSVKGETISLYGFDTETKFTTDGLKYPLNSVALPFGIRESTSNVSTGETVSVKIKGGKAFIIRDFKFLVDNGLF